MNIQGSKPYISHNLLHIGWVSLMLQKCHLLKLIVVIKVLGAMAFSCISSQLIFLTCLLWVKTVMQAVTVGLLTWDELLRPSNLFMHLSPKSVFILCWQWEGALTVIADSTYTQHHAALQGQTVVKYEPDLCSPLPRRTPSPHQYLQSEGTVVTLFSQSYAEAHMVLSLQICRKDDLSGEVGRVTCCEKLILQ